MTGLDLISYIAIGLGILSALIILIDVLKNPQHMKIMSIVWPIQGLYLGPFAIWFYWVMGRQKSDDHGGHHHHSMNHDMMEHAEEHDLDTKHQNHNKGNTHDHMEMSHEPHDHGNGHDHSEHMNMDQDQGHHSHSMHGNKPFYQSVFVSTSHCSSGCTIGDLIGAPLVFLLGLTIAGSMLFADYVVEFILAYVFGVFFQVFSIVPMNPGMSWGKGFVEAIKADTLSLIAFEIGMFGWMAIVHYGIFSTNVPEPNNPTFWFMMQIAMILGTATSYPANWFLVKKGVKHGM